MRGSEERNFAVSGSGGGEMRIDKIMKEAKKLQSKMSEVQKKLSEMRLEGNSGGGMVKAIVDGQQNLIEVKIDPEVVKGRACRSAC